MNVFRRVGGAIKAAAQSFALSFGYGNGGWGSWGSWGSLAHWGYDGLQNDYSATIGNGRGNSIVAATLNWQGKKFPNGKLALHSLLTDGTKEDVLVHPFLQLMKKPNPFYSGRTMMRAALADWTVTGDGYLIKQRGPADRVVRLWYAPSFMMEPISSDPLTFIQYYRYTPGDRETRLRPEDVVHLRNGIDPENMRKGLSPLRAIVRELFTDDQAALWVAAILKNSGVPGVVISPADDSEITPANGEIIKSTYVQRFGGANRGAPLVLTDKVKIDRVAFSPNDINLRDVRQIPEERVTAVLGVPAIVAGMGAGLAQSAYANVTTLREIAVEDGILPTYQDWAEQLQAQLLGDFEVNPDAFEVYFDTSEIRELQPDQDKLVARETQKLLAGGITLAEYRDNVGEDPPDDPTEGAIYYVPVNVVVTPADALAPQPLPLSPANPAPAALPAPTALPTAAGLDDADVEVKALAVMNGIVGLRARLHDAETRAMLRLLGRQKRAALDSIEDVVKEAVRLDVERKGPDLETIQARLARLNDPFNTAMRVELERLHLRSAGGVHDLVGTWARLDLPIKPERRQAYLREAGLRVTGITKTTLDAMANTIRASVFAGETLEETTARVDGLHVFGQERAETIVRTELAIATNRAAITTYEDSGIVTHVRVHDGTHDDGACAALNGRTFTLEAAAGIPAVEHPRCIRSFEPLTADQMPLLSSNHNGHVDHKELIAA